MVTSFSVIIEDNPLVAEDISATLQSCFPTSNPRVYTSVDHARQANSSSGAPLVIVMSLGLSKIGQLVDKDLEYLKDMPVLWIDAMPQIEPDGARWHVVSMPFTHDTLSDALRRFAPVAVSA